MVAKQTMSAASATSKPQLSSYNINAFCNHLVIINCGLNLCHIWYKTTWNDSVYQSRFIPFCILLFYNFCLLTIDLFHDNLFKL